MLPMEWVQVLSTFGFPAFFAVLLFVTYRSMVEQIIEVVRANTQAVQQFCQRMEALERVVQRNNEGNYVERR